VRGGIAGENFLITLKIFYFQWKHIEDDEDMAQKKKNTPVGEMLM
jgi:hypothetical protein